MIGEPHNFLCDSQLQLNMNDVKLWQSSAWWMEENHQLQVCCS
jgi:hypothetical protein